MAIEPFFLEYIVWHIVALLFSLETPRDMEPPTMRLETFGVEGGGRGGGAAGACGAGLAAKALVRVGTCVWVVVRARQREFMRSRSSWILSVGKDGGRGSLSRSSWIRAISSGLAGSGVGAPVVVLLEEHWVQVWEGVEEERFALLRRNRKEEEGMRVPGELVSSWGGGWPHPKAQLLLPRTVSWGSLGYRLFPPQVRVDYLSNNILTDPWI